MKSITIIGSTGSIGRQTLDVVRHHSDKYKIKGLVCHKDYEALLKQDEEFLPDFIALTDTEASRKLSLSNHNGKLLNPDTALTDAVTDDTDVLVVACGGINGLLPTLCAIKNGINVALANKETLVVGGAFVKESLSKSKAVLFPVDSEHSAILQSINSNNKDDIKRIIITASGGAFRDFTKEQLKFVTARDALKHPNWNMGKKITIDCATLMNKGLEIIEATYLFDIGAEKITPVIHPESIIHSMVEYNDSAVIAQMGNPSMLVPISYALSYPERLDTGVTPIDFVKLGSLNFREPDRTRFPCLRIAESVARDGGLIKTVMNATNDAAVELFLQGKIGFMQIPEIIENELSGFSDEKHFTVEDVFKCDEFIKNKIVKRYRS